MKFQDLKYLLAYIIPISAIWGLFQSGIGAYSTFIVAFIIVPLLEQFIRQQTSNVLQDEVETKERSFFFDLLLYLNVPIIYFLLFIFFTRLMIWDSLNTVDIVGYCLSVGIVLGSSGINVAHELGHKQGRFQQLCAKLLLLPNYYLHFIIEHNRGHHVHVATPLDPATSRKNEMIYSFWLRSTFFSFMSAWNIEKKRLASLSLPYISRHNEIIHFIVFQLIYFLVVAILFSPFIALFSIVVGLIGILLLETINYIEHYGLVRKKLASGRYERVKVTHSWNSNYEIGRIILYELTRHSDHHYKSTKKFQVLNHYDESPQLPMGYPASMLMALVPPLWIKVMNKRLEKYHQKMEITN